MRHKERKILLQLRKFRNEKNMTQKELASRLGVRCNTVCQYEIGTREPNLKILKQMSIVLQCSLDELVA